MKSKLDSTMYDIHHIGAEASRDQWMNRKHPLIKFIITICYIVAVVSVNKYDLPGIIRLSAYPIAGFLLSELSVRGAFKRMGMVLPLVCLVGIFNPILDHSVIQFGTLRISGGIISMLTLMLKGILTLLASYLLAATTSIEGLCAALEMLHVPGILVTQFMLMYRYVFMFLAEVRRVTESYQLRAPGQKGINIKIWGSLVGNMLLRSIDRADKVYESMLLRGYNGSFIDYVERKKPDSSDYIYLVICLAGIFIFRIIL